MYDTSDIRKGLKIMIDGAPYTIVEFQFVKPGKGAAFTRTKMKNLLTGAVLERNLRSGDKLEPADVETKTMQYLYADGGDYVFMDTTTYDQMHVRPTALGDAADYLVPQAVANIATKYSQDLSAITALNNKPAVYFRLTDILAPQNTGGQSRVDNILVTGIPEPNSLMILVLAAAAVMLYGRGW